jgi:hypothetical protein
MRTKRINIELATKLISKLLKVIKPNGVSNIEFDLKPCDYNEFYMNIVYVVPENSDLLKMNPFSYSDGSRYDYNRLITKDIKDMFDFKVIINNSGVRNEKFNYGQ